MLSTFLFTILLLHNTYYIYRLGRVSGYTLQPSHILKIFEKQNVQRHKSCLKCFWRFNCEPVLSENRGGALCGTMVEACQCRLTLRDGAEHAIKTKFGTFCLFWAN